MVTGLLFKWEDSPTLKHHCGFCDRPLSHPGARASCFGTHAEPCHRYHQTMFMRLRGHTCSYCLTIDEAHYSRHEKIAKRLRDVYDLAGEEDWPIVPSDAEEIARATAYNLHSPENGVPHETPTLLEMPASKRERKEIKSLARAASRPKVITRNEILYVDSIIHSPVGTLGGNDDGPRNLEDIEEISRHLKYNADVYNRHASRRDLKNYAQIPDVDIDFEAEMERILDAFRITELLRRNTKTRGLQGKELKELETLVETFNKCVVEDLVHVKMDIMEVRMRRAGYLRYTNRTVYSIVEARYADKDWKTGEKYSSNSSESSRLTYAVEEDTFSSEETEKQNTQPLPPKHEPDRRHLEHTHMRVNGDDGLGQHIIEPYHAPLLPVIVDSSRRRAVQLKVVDKKAPVMMMAPTTSSTRNNRIVPADAWETVLSRKKSKAPSVKPTWGMDADGRPVAQPRPAVNPWGPDACEIPDLRAFEKDRPMSSNNSAVQSPDTQAVSASSGPEQLVTQVNYPSSGYPVVSQKKVKKYTREAKRKAKKIAAESGSPTVPEFEVNNVIGTIETSSSVAPEAIVESANVNIKQPSLGLCAASSDSAEFSNAQTYQGSDTELEEIPRVFSPFAGYPVTCQNKQIHWLKFRRFFIADQLSNPFLHSCSRCSHDTTCVFEMNGIVDCPYHEPYCSCVDPIADQCFLVYPHPEVLSCGPFNRIRGEKLMTMYQEHHDFKGRVMLVDDDCVHYVTLDPHERVSLCNPVHIPERLQQEYDDFVGGLPPGLLMEQERLFERLWCKNKLIKHSITKDMLNKVQEQQHANCTKSFFCYCHAPLPKRGLPKDVVECAYRHCAMRYYHKSCIKKLGLEKVSRWYCTTCALKIRAHAHHTLHAMDCNAIPDDKAVLDCGMEKPEAHLHVPPGVMEDVFSHMTDLAAHQADNIMLEALQKIRRVHT